MTIHSNHQNVLSRFIFFLGLEPVVSSELGSTSWDAALLAAASEDDGVISGRIGEEGGQRSLLSIVVPWQTRFFWAACTNG